MNNSLGLSKTSNWLMMTFRTMCADYEIGLIYYRVFKRDGKLVQQHWKWKYPSNSHNYVSGVLSSNIGFSWCLDVGCCWCSLCGAAGQVKRSCWMARERERGCSIRPNDELYWKDKWLDESCASSRGWQRDTGQGWWCCHDCHDNIIQWTPKLSSLILIGTEYRGS